MRRWKVLSLLLVIGIAASSAAGAQCPAAPPVARNPTVRMERFEPRLVYHHELDLLGLSRVGHTYEQSPPGQVRLGLTAHDDELQVNLRAYSQRLPDGRFCVWPVEVVARVGDPAMDVYVAGIYPVGSCEYNVVLAHENSHVAINRSVVQAYAPQMAGDLQAAVRRLFPRIVARQDEIKELPRLVMAALAPTNNAMLAELRRRNGEIDTPENYRRTKALCSNWFPAGTRVPR